MKPRIWMLFTLTASIILNSAAVNAQRFDKERMDRDIAVAENVLYTLIKQQFANQRTFFQLQVRGSYQAGYGVTFVLPADYTTPIVLQQNDMIWTPAGGGTNVSIYDGSTPRSQDVIVNRQNRQNNSNVESLGDQSRERAKIDMDSIRDASNKKVIDAAATFLLDYGDLIAQLAPNEKVIVTNQGNQPRAWVNQYFSAPKRTHLSVEALKSDLTLLRTGKLTREQAQSRLKVINTETVEEVEADLELLSSIFTRLYSEDISKTYFVGDNVYFEHLKDFGAIYYMTMFSAIEMGDYSRRYILPTIGLADVDQATRDKKVKEMYPKFESDLKENILEYGRTLKSLKDDEVLVFQITNTRCEGCSIPVTLEITLKGSALKEYSLGKADKAATLAKMTVKKGAAQ
ncbi:hypothetical protein WBG78_15570 [Chryseolinea sp. T2]|uniref:hypothetical protein n=1 Tax=Chryseolinea sp. T2 TaxID=3129255 RepID=UPI0030772D1F